MLKLVADANILFSFFKRDSTARELITSVELLKLYSPELALKELTKYKELICKKSKLNETEFEESLKALKLFVSFESEDFFKKLLPKARKISPDIDDAAYFALALKLGCSIWSNERRLKRQSVVKVLTTEDLARLL